MALLEVMNISARYGSIVALRDVSLTVEPGSVVSVVGPNGAGKSTLLKVIAGAHSASAGQLVFDGSTITGQPPERIARRGIAFVPEGRRLFPRLTVADNLAVGAAAATSRTEAAASIARLREAFPLLQRKWGSPAGSLSGGEQQQVAIARALVSQPKLLLLDEPSLGLAPTIVDVVYDQLADLRSSGTTVLLIEQHVVRSLEIADHAYVLNLGQIASAGVPSSLGTDQEMEDAYFGFETGGQL